jgi:hypothetical protein
MYFWLDFLWNETVSDQVFEDYQRAWEIDLPIKISLPETHPVNVGIKHPLRAVTEPPTSSPTDIPTNKPSFAPTTSKPTHIPTELPSDIPSNLPSTIPSDIPTYDPSTVPTTSTPTTIPSNIPSTKPHAGPSKQPVPQPSQSPSLTPRCNLHTCSVGYELLPYNNKIIGEDDETCCQEIESEYTLVGNGQCADAADLSFHAIASTDASNENVTSICNEWESNCFGYSEDGDTSTLFITDSASIDDFSDLIDSTWTTLSTCDGECGTIDTYEDSGNFQCFQRSNCWAYHFTEANCRNNFCSHNGTHCLTRDEMRKCDRVNDCNNHGSTSGNDANIGCACLCDDGYEGSACETKTVCSSENCNMKGSASGFVADGCTCTCEDGWAGDDCSEKLEIATVVTLDMTCDEVEDHEIQIIALIAQKLGVDVNDMQYEIDCNTITVSGGDNRRNMVDEDSFNFTLTIPDLGDIDAKEDLKDDFNDEQVEDEITSEAQNNGLDLSIITFEVIEPCTMSDCNNHGWTEDQNNANGCICHCYADWTGDDCNTPRACDARDCSGHGTTTDDDARDGCECECEDAWYGSASDCSVERMCDATDCNLNGYPDEGTVNDGCKCNCEPNWMGDFCDIPRTCTRENDCNDNGDTDDTDATDGCDCECDIPWGGWHCEIRWENPTEQPTESPTDGPTTVPTSSKPTEIPSNIPSTAPTMIPSNGPTNVPSAAPVAESVVVWMLDAYASEINDENTRIRIDLTFTTAVNEPWELSDPSADGEEVIETISFDKLSETGCSLGSDKYEDMLCQKWNFQFYTNRHCNGGNREVVTKFTAEYKLFDKFHTVTLPLELSSSSPFECAEDLGSFEITAETKLSHNGDSYYLPENANAFLIGERFWMKISFSSGASNIVAVNLTDISISTASVPGNFLCNACQNREEMDFDEESKAHTGYIVSFIFDDDLFPNPQSLTIMLRFDITYADGRRRLAEVTLDDLEEFIRNHASLLTVSIAKPTTTTPTPTETITTTEETFVERMEHVSGASSNELFTILLVILIVISGALVCFWCFACRNKCDSNHEFAADGIASEDSILVGQNDNPPYESY